MGVKMKGSVLTYDDSLGTGLISGADGLRYSFVRADLMQLVPIGPGTRVDFDFEGKVAKEVYLDVDETGRELSVARSTSRSASITKLAGRQKWAVVLLWIFFGATIFDAFSQWLEIELLQQIAAGSLGDGDTLRSAATANDQRQQVAAMLFLFTFIASGIASLMWTYRAAVNSAALQPSPPRMSPGWSVGWYFIPIAWLWKPYQAMAEIWRRSASPAEQSAGGLLGWWWFLWIATSFAGQVLMRLSLRSDDVSSLLTAGWVNLFIGAATIPLILIYLRVISSISAMQAARVREGSPYYGTAP